MSDQDQQQQTKKTSMINKNWTIDKHTHTHIHK